MLLYRSFRRARIRIKILWIPGSFVNGSLMARGERCRIDFFRRTFTLFSRCSREINRERERERENLLAYIDSNAKSRFPRTYFVVRWESILYRVTDFSELSSNIEHSWTADKRTDETIIFVERTKEEREKFRRKLRATAGSNPTAAWTLNYRRTVNRGRNNEDWVPGEFSSGHSRNFSPRMRSYVCLYTDVCETEGWSRLLIQQRNPIRS